MTTKVMEIYFAEYKGKHNPLCFSRGSESEFMCWCENEVIFKSRSKGLPFNEVAVTKKHWERLLKKYNNSLEVEFLKAQYPDGFFEAKNDEGTVATLLPDTYGDKQFRVSTYRSNGPTGHKTFQYHHEAIQHLAENRFHVAHGALDELIGTNEWNRGLWVCKWANECGSSFEGLKRDLLNSEVQKIFSEDIKLYREKNLI